MSTERSPTPNADRVHFIDALRLAATTQMVIGHTLHVLLRPELKHGVAYDYYRWFRGLTSVAFLLAAGMSFYVANRSRLFDSERGSRGWRVATRAVQLIVIGWYLQVPISAIVGPAQYGWTALLHDLARTDALMCLALSLVILECVFATTRGMTQLMLTCAVMSLSAAIATPFSAHFPDLYQLRWLAWLGPRSESPFPLLPYTGYALAGVVLAGLALGSHSRLPSAVTFRRLVCAAFAFAALAWGMGSLHGVWPTGWAAAYAPRYFFTKLSVVTFGVAALAFALRDGRRFPDALRVLSRESLAIYVFHLTLLYGFPFALHQRVGASLELHAALAVSAGVLAASIGVAFGWHHTKQRSHTWRPLVAGATDGVRARTAALAKLLSTRAG